MRGPLFKIKSKYFTFIKNINRFLGLGKGGGK